MNQALPPPDREQLARRWHTTRGRETREALLQDLRHEDGAHLLALAAPLRRPGVAEGKPDLRGIDLAGEDLAAASLRAADLQFADLRGCDLACAALDGADLRRADLREARLRGATLRKARLDGADLRQADLTDAELSGATLESTRLGQARLRRTRFVGSDLTRANLVGADVAGAITRAPLAQAPQARRTIGPPPATEPRRIAQRRTLGVAPAPQLAPAPAGPAPAPAREAKLILHPSVKAERAELQRAQLEFDAALGRLLALRGSVEKITALVDGAEQVLFSREQAAEKRVILPA